MTPAAFRVTTTLAKNSEPSADRSRLLDGDALLHYASLDIGSQKDVARDCGTTSRQVMNNLLEVDASIDLS
jgi:hypothetical protein